MKTAKEMTLKLILAVVTMFLAISILLNVKLVQLIKEQSKIMNGYQDLISEMERTVDSLRSKPKSPQVTDDFPDHSELKGETLNTRQPKVK